MAKLHHTTLLPLLIFASAILVTPCRAQQADYSADSSSAVIDKVELSGFVSAWYFGNAETGENSYALRELELDIERRYGDFLLLRADLESRSSSQSVNGTQTGGAPVLDAIRPELGFLQFGPSFAPRLSLTLGRFQAPFGLEPLDPHERRFASETIVPSPATLTGAAIGAELGYGLTASLYAANGWDRGIDNNEGKAFGASIAGAGQRITGTAAFLFSSEDEEELRDTWLAGGDFLIEALDWLDIGGEASAGLVTSDRPRYDDALWYGGMLALHIEPHPVWSLHLRGDMVYDQDGYLFGLAEDTWIASATIAPAAVLGYGMLARLEVRTLLSNEDPYLNANGWPTDLVSELALEMVYVF